MFNMQTYCDVLNLNKLCDNSAKGHHTWAPNVKTLPIGTYDVHT